jgi:uncharacterized protein GlcG (DUF336 family)
MEITAEQSLLIIQRIAAKAREIKIPVTIVVVDTAGHIKSLQRMDDALLGSIDIAMAKAKTAMLFRNNTESVGEWFTPDAKNYGIMNTNGGVVGFKGGMPVRSGDQIIAYIGVSGGTSDQDFEIASAGSKF